MTDEQKRKLNKSDFVRPIPSRPAPTGFAAFWSNVLGNEMEQAPLAFETSPDVLLIHMARYLARSFSKSTVYFELIDRVTKD